jgi:hypothetical protein
MNRLRTDFGPPEARKVLSDERRDYVKNDMITVQTDAGAMNMSTKGKSMVEALNDYNRNPRAYKTKLYPSQIEALKRSDAGKL